MNKRRATFRQRLGAAIAGSSRKAFIPALNPFDGIGPFWGGSRSNAYATKPDQVTANVGWSFAANTAITEPAAAVELQLFQIKNNGDREQIFKHDILDLLNGPNNAHTGEQLRQLHFTYMNFTGESYILMTGKDGKPFEPGSNKLPFALQILESHLVSFKREPLFSQSIVKIGQNDFPIRSVIRTINPNPLRPYDGMSVIEAAAQTIDLDRAMKEWNQSLVENGAKPSLIFSSNEPMDDESYKRWKAQFIDDNTGAANAGKPLLIEGGDAKPWMMSPQDLDFLNSRKFSMDEILAMWKVPAAMLGMSKDYNRANMDAAKAINAEINIVPRVRQLVAQLNQTLVKPFDPSLELSFVNPVPEDRVQKLKEAVEGVNKIWTIDEVRAMYGEEALPDGLGAQMYVPSLTVSLDSVADAGAEDDPSNQDADEDDPAGNEDPKATKSLHGVKKKS